MKFTVNVECTPEEARAFMGLPDVQPMQEAMMQDFRNASAPIWRRWTRTR